METHPQKAEDMQVGELDSLVRAINPILDQLIDGAIKGELHGDDLVDIANRIRGTLQEAVARRSIAGSTGG